MFSQATSLFHQIRSVRRHRLAWHLLLLVGVGAVVGVFYRSWFSQGGFTLPVWATYGREVVGVIIQYYVLIWLFGRYSSKPRYLLPGLLVYYWLTYTYQFVSAVVVYDYTGLDDFSGAAYHFIQHKNQYWQTLFSYETLMRLLRFPILITIFPLLLWTVREGYRRQLRNAELQQQNAQLELNYLKSQVNPHFLFNILNSIYALTEEESPRAAQLVAQLSGLMRYALYETAEPFVPLAREVSFIRDYVALEQTRTGKRLTLAMSLPDRVEEDLQIAPFILITFVENAFKHGVASTTRPAWVTLSMQIEHNQLTLHVANSKPAGTAAPAGGVGLRNVQKRLALLYPNLHTLTVSDQPNDYRITLILQFTTTV